MEGGQIGTMTQAMEHEHENSVILVDPVDEKPFNIIGDQKKDAFTGSESVGSDAKFLNSRKKATSIRNCHRDQLEEGVRMNHASIWLDARFNVITTSPMLKSMVLTSEE